jgi:hypothetical protein
MASMLERSNRVLSLCGALVVLAAAACGDESTPPEPEPDVRTIRVTVGTSTVDVPYPSGTQPAVIPLRVSQVNQVSFRFLGADGQDEPLIVAERANLELDMDNLEAGWTFAATGGSGATFTANITPSNIGSFVPRLILFNTEHGHNEVQRIIMVNVTQ